MALYIRISDSNVAILGEIYFDLKPFIARLRTYGKCMSHQADGTSHFEDAIIIKLTIVAHVDDYFLSDDDENCTRNYFIDCSSLLC
jgi:hypothetical protein